MEPREKGTQRSDGTVDLSCNQTDFMFRVQQEVKLKSSGTLTLKHCGVASGDSYSEYEFLSVPSPRPTRHAKRGPYKGWFP